MPAPKNETLIRYPTCAGETSTERNYSDHNATTHTNEGNGQDNQFSFITDPQSIVEDLFKGTSASSGAYEKACTSQEGSIRGVGPDCVTTQEEGEYDLAVCFYKRTYECLRVYKDDTSDACENFVTIIQDNLDDATENSGAAASMNYPDAARQMQIAANKAYNDCIEDIKNQCECKTCLFTIAKPTEEEEEEDDDEPNTEEETPATSPGTTTTTTKVEKKTTSLSSGFGPIARVFGRYVVGGNVIWLGAKEATTKTFYKEGDANVPANYTLAQEKVEFIVAISLGELDSLLRVWFNDVLVYNTYIDLDDPSGSAFTDLNLSILAEDANNTTQAYDAHAKIRLYGGTKGQKVLKEHADVNGFGYAPAYRNVAYVHLKNVDLRLFGGSFPQIRFDVMSETPDNYVQKIEGPEIADLYEHQLSLNPRTNYMLAQKTDNTAALIDHDTLEVSYTAPVDTASYAMSSYTNRILSYDGLDSYLRDPFLGDYNTTGGPSPAYQDYRGIMGREIKYYDNDHIPHSLFLYESYLFSVAFIDYDIKKDANVENFGFLSAGTYIPGIYIPQDLAVGSHGGTTYAYQIGFNDVYDIVVSKVPIKVGGELKDFVLDAEVTVYNIPNASLWNDVSDHVITNTIYDGTDGSFLVFARRTDSTKHYIMKLDGETLTVKWFYRSPVPFDYWNEMGQPATNYATDYFYFIGTDSEVYRLTREDGALVSFGTLASQGFPPYQTTRGQYYDAHTKSLTYVSTDTGRDPKLVRLFFERLVPTRVALSTIIQSLADQANLPANYIDTSDIEEITVGGYVITERTTLRTVLEEFAQFYQLSIVDDGVSLRVMKQTSLSSSVTIDEDYDIIEQSFATQRVVPSSMVDTAIASYVNIGPNGLEEAQQTVAIREQTDEKTPARKVGYELKVYDYPEVISPYLELALNTARSSQDVFTAALMPRMLALTSNDRVTVGGRDYRISTNTFSPMNHAEVRGTYFFYDRVTALADILGYSLNNNASVKRTARMKPYKPIVLFTNALATNDAARAASTRQVAYTLVEAPEADIDPTRVSVYTHEHSGLVNMSPTTALNNFGKPYTIPASPTWVSQPHTKAAHSGVLQDAPNSRLNLLYATPDAVFRLDPADTMTVKFHRIDSVALLKDYSADPHAVQETMDNFFIVGTEYIQAASFAVDPGDSSGKTVILSKLFRGNFGTELSAGGHVDGLGRATYTYGKGRRIYLYTPDTIKAIGVGAKFTKRRPYAKVWIKGTTPAGWEVLDTAIRADAGSARAWAPTDVNVYNNGVLATTVYLGWKRREPFAVNHLENGGVLSNSFGSTKYYVAPSATFQYSNATIEAAFDQDNPNYKKYDVTVDGTVLTTVPFTFTSTPPATRRYSAIAQITYDEDGNEILGYIANVVIPPGFLSTYPRYP